MFTTENDYEYATGVIVVRDGRNLKALDEFPAYGIGPHEVKMMPDGVTLAVAVGGILTHPDDPRENLNIESMSPNLSYIDSHNGKLIGQYRVSDHQLSIRHIDVSLDGRVAIGMQYEGPAKKMAPLVAFHRGEDQIATAKADVERYQSMNQYTGAVCSALDNDVTAVSCPRGGQVTFWNRSTSEYMDALLIPDTGGIALSSDQRNFIVSSGNGSIYKIDIQSLSIVDQTRIQEAKWDNHMIAVS